jgi:tetratricopeptide (TPR) repeat protein
MAEPQRQPPSPKPDPAALLRDAVAHHQRGDLSEAETLYRLVLAAQPGHFEALRLCGVLMQQRGRSEEALALIGDALAANAQVATAHFNYGVVLAALGRAEEAVAAYDRALALKPDYAEALYSRGNALTALGRLEEALASFDRAVTLRPGYVQALINRAQILKQLERPHEALNSFDRAFALAPPNADALIARGNVHHGLKSFAAALTDYDRALSLRPDAAPAYNNRGNVLRELGRHEEAMASFDRAIALAPDYADAYNSRGNAQFELNRLEEAIADYDRALAIDPDHVGALVNRGSVLRHLSRFEEALNYFDRAIGIDPDLAVAHWNRALTCLEAGDFEAGWRDYEWRWHRDPSEMRPRDFVQPQWQGEDLKGKTILLHAEQGFGDTLQFIRYLPMVLAKGGQVVLEVPDDLKPLIAPAEGVSAIVRRGDALPPFDVHCPLMSLPLAFKTTLTTIPANVPYLRAPADRVETWRARLSPSALPRIGLVWSGKPTYKNDHNRSIALATFKPLLSKPDFQFVSLQKEYRARDSAALHELSRLERLDAGLADFADTAAVVELLDLVITVDTAVAHLAGGLGKPVWILLPVVGDWRWLSAREDSPWYPSARLFRQPRVGDWDSVIARLGRELDAFAGARCAATE